MRLILALLGLMLCWEAGATDWFVRPATGEYGAEDGSSYAAAFDGFSDITWGAPNVVAGDTVYICGTFDASSADGGGAIMLQVGVDGSAGNIVTFDGNCSAQGDLSQAIIDPQNNASVTQGIKTDARPYITLKNIIIKNITGTLALGVQLYTATTEGATAKNIIIDNVDVYDINGDDTNDKCIVGYGTNITVKNSTISGCTDDGVFIQGSNAIVTNNIISRVSQETTGGDCVQVTGGNTVAATGANIANNTCDHSDVDAKQCFMVGQGTDTEVSFITDNTCSLPVGSTVSNGIYSEHDTAYILRNTTTGGNMGIKSGVDGVNQWVIGNIVNRTTERGISGGSAATSLRVFNNTIYDCNNGTIDGACVATDANNANVEIRNNSISIGLGAGIDVQGASVVETNNNVYNVTTPSSTNCSTVGCAAQSRSLNASDTTANPLYSGGSSPSVARDFRPDVGSPLRRAGLELNLGNLQDNGNRAFHHPPSIGAWEATSGDDATTRTAATRTAATRSAATTRTAR